MGGGVVRIERRSGKCTDSVGRFAGHVGGERSNRGIVEVGTEDGLCGRKQLGRQRGLPPPHHLRVKPRGLQRFGTAGILAAEKITGPIVPGCTG